MYSMYDLHWVVVESSNNVYNDYDYLARLLFSCISLLLNNFAFILKEIFLTVRFNSIKPSLILDLMLMYDIYQIES